MAVTETLSSIRTLTDKQAAAVSLWEGWILRDIERRAAASGLTLADLDPVDVERFTVEAITYRLDNPPGTKRLDVQADDTRVSRELAAPTTGFVYLDEWWGWLGLGDEAGPGEAFTIVPASEPDPDGYGLGGYGFENTYHRRFR